LSVLTIRPILPSPVEEARRLTRSHRKLAVHLILALSLLVAQAAAQAHVYSHLQAGSARSDTSGVPVQLCTDCLSGASLLGGASAPDAPPVLFAAAISTPVAAPPVSFVEFSRHYAFRSRAPPDLP
jgi:hypothetical protein